MEQGSDAWIAARLGLPTASNGNAILATGRGGGVSKTRLTYLRKLAGERITGMPAENFTNAAMDRGHALEGEARQLYAFAAGVEVQQVGIGLNHGAGASPDGLVGEVGMLEIKSCAPHLLIGHLEAGRPPPEHTAQLQFNLWVFEREWIDLMLYFPGMPVFQSRIERDDAWIVGTLCPAVCAFLDELEDLVARYPAGDSSAIARAE